MINAEQNNTKQPSMSEAILALYANLPHLEQSLNEIRELKERVLIKEKELQDAISQNKIALERVFAGTADDFTALLKANGNQTTIVDDESESHNNVNEVKMYPKDEDDLTRVYYQRDTNSLIARELAEMTSQPMDETMAADLVIKQRRDELRKKQQVIEEKLSKTKNEQGRIESEIVEAQKAMEKLERLIEERRPTLQECEAEKDILFERKRLLETELETLGQKYCSLNEEVNGTSAEESNLRLQTIRNSVDQKEPSDKSLSPLLQKYAVVASQLNEHVAQVAQLDLKLSDLGDKEYCRQLEEVKGKLASNRELIPMLEREQEQLTTDLKNFESEEKGLQTTVQDLIVAMKWGKSAARELYEPNPLTAPLLLLLFQQYCLLQVHSDQPNPTTVMSEEHLIEKSEQVFASLNLAGYVATAARKTGKSALELRESGYSPQAIKEAGYSLAEMKESGISPVELKAMGYTASELKGVGYTAEELSAGDYSSTEILTAGFALEEMTVTDKSNLSTRLMRTLGYTVLQLRKEGYSAKDVRSGGYTMKEINEAGYSLWEMKDSGISAGALKQLGYGVSRLKDVGYTAQEVKAAGYSVQEINGAGYSLQAMKAGGFSTSALQRLGYTASQLKKVGYTEDDLTRGGTLSA
jgi:hypothetical protein